MEKLKKNSVLESSAENLIQNILHASSSSNCYQILVSVREKVSKNPKFLSEFISAGGIKALIEQLKKPQKKLVDVSLSILSHCVIQPEPRIQVS